MIEIKVSNTLITLTCGLMSENKPIGTFPTNCILQKHKTKQT